MKTRVTELLGIKYPVILGGLQWLGRAELAAAVSEAGGFGLITAGSFANKDEMLAEINKARKLTSKPIGLNITLGTRRKMDEFFEGAIEAGIKAVFTSGRNPEPYIKSLKDAGVKIVHVVPGVRYAQKAESLGVDAVVIVGFEAGGHPGMDDVTLMSLIPKASRVLEVPIIAAGAIADGKGLAAALAMGAEGVQIGTRFVATKECIAHQKVKEAITKASETDTILTLRSINAAFRVLKTETAKKVLELENRSASMEELLTYAGGDAYVKVVRDGNLEAGMISIGQGVGLINEVKSVRDVIKSMISEAKDRLQVLNRFFNSWEV